MSEFYEALERMQAVLRHQLDPNLHPLTCGVDSNHRPLVPAMTTKGHVVLRCADCSYMQSHVPAFLGSESEPAPGEAP